ncbi:MAG: UDP-N-acetylmuramate dehydrogenase [Myxococcales bacterium]|nr:UDP-N-acetylmuramate dehydrogenase [Myxococcales bacterium]
MRARVRDELQKLLGDRVRFDVPLARLTSLRVGGPVEAVAAPAHRDELLSLLQTCSELQIPQRVLGSGFNVLAPDEGLPGVVIRLTRFRELETLPAGLRAEAGVSHSQITRRCSEQGLAGLEFTAGIPGSVGGWLTMNAGIPGREIKDVVREVEVASPEGRAVRRFEARELDFGYRELRGLAPGSVLLSALFEVTQGSAEAVRAAVDTLLAKRARSQPLDVPSCGSVFKNPAGDHAGRMLEAAGLKGFRIGGAQISPVHANFIANTGGATSGDVLALIREARQRVLEATGQHLDTEVHVLGGAA